MQVWRHIGQKQWAKATIGIAAAEYLRFVGMTSRFTLEPDDVYQRGEADMPIILAFWHGQHLLAPVARKIEHRVNMLVSRHRDGEINAVAAERLGVGTIRGSGSRDRDFLRKGGVAGFRQMLDALGRGYNVALTADIPKVSRVAGLGIIKLAQASGRPIYPSAIATSRRIVLNNWDRTTINLPFSRGAGVAAEPMSVALDADDAALEAARRDILRRVRHRMYRFHVTVGQDVREDQSHRENRQTEREQAQAIVAQRLIEVAEVRYHLHIAEQMVLDFDREPFVCWI